MYIHRQIYLIFTVPEAFVAGEGTYPLYCRSLLRYASRVLTVLYFTS